MAGAFEHPPSHRVRQALEAHRRIKRKLRETSEQAREQQHQAQQALEQVIQDETARAAVTNGSPGQAA